MTASQVVKCQCRCTLCRLTRLLVAAAGARLYAGRVPDPLVTDPLYRHVLDAKRKNRGGQMCAPFEMACGHKACPLNADAARHNVPPLYVTCPALTPDVRTASPTLPALLPLWTTQVDHGTTGTSAAALHALAPPRLGPIVKRRELSHGVKGGPEGLGAAWSRPGAGGYAAARGQTPPQRYFPETLETKTRCYLLQAETAVAVSGMAVAM
jgi:hypothetical protein